MANSELQTPDSNIPSVKDQMDHLWSRVLGDLRDLSTATIQKNIELATRVGELEQELQVWKIARTATQDEVERARKENQYEKLMLEQRIAALESEKSFMVYCVIDGDSGLFADSLVKKGITGGLEAARTLSNNVKDCIDRLGYDSNEKKQFWVSIFYSKSVLESALSPDAAEQLEQFYQGFTQNSARFVLVNSGPSRKHTKEKVKAYLDSYSRNPQTLKIFFVGGQANGYFDTLSHIEQDHILDKIVCLRGSRDLAAELQSLPLQTLKIDRLFSQLDEDENIVFAPNSHLTPPATNRSETPSMASHISSLTPAMPVSSRGPVMNGTSSEERMERRRLKRIDTRLPLNKQVPPPCNEHYILKRCAKEARGEECKYDHDYDLSDEQIETLRENAKNKPCWALINGKECYFGDDCIWGHKCPKGPSCFFFTIGRCWFKSVDFHRPDSATDSGSGQKSPPMSQGSMHIELSPVRGSRFNNSFLDH